MLNLETLPQVVAERRGILRAALASGLALLGSRPSAAAPAIHKTHVVLQETHVAGTAYYKANELVEALAPGQLLALRRQPDNPYDDLAIEVLTLSGDKLGYVPRRANPPYARMIDAGYVLSARIAVVKPGAWDLVRMEIGLEAPSPPTS